MSEQFRLLFRGEVLEGQHPAVVRKKLGQLLGLDDARLGRLFSGQLVIVKAEADADAAARIEATFRRAGAQLTVETLEGAAVGDGVTGVTASEGLAPTDATESTAPPVASSFAPEVLPVGSDVLREDEREAWTAREVDTAHLVLQTGDAKLPEPPPPPPAPDTSRLSLLEP
jgi:hypothetical protein